MKSWISNDKTSKPIISTANSGVKKHDGYKYSEIEQEQA